MNNRFIVILAALLFLTLSSCKNNQKTKSETKQKNEKVIDFSAPEWSKNATIYEVNLRQYTPKGDINSFIPYVGKLKKMGIDILWIMPPYPIGKEKRKGELGSPYSISDYTSINPDLGTIEDFKKLVEKVHALDMKIILDWVGNHSSFDNHWATEHPGWYTKDSLGKITHPKGTDWTDVADFNYDNKEFRTAMIDAMKFWIEKCNIDGYRCDVAGYVPNDFWKEAITELQKLKHVFMLAEWDAPELHDAGFQMTYGWEFHHIINQIAKGKMVPLAIDTFLKKDYGRYPADAYRMNFTTNHDENSWNGTIEERMGKSGDVMNILCFTLQGMPLIYSGQEAGLNKRLSFFGKDTIDWSDNSKQEFYEKLLALKHRNTAVWNGKYGAKPVKIKTDNDKIYSYIRQKGDDAVVVISNLSDKKQSFKLTDNIDLKPVYKDVFSGEQKSLKDWFKDYSKIGAWKYVVLEKTK